ncbi:MAG TPA: 2-oxoglutarate dehydrogenase complex dihydrolipoyllysine-residue succinyltransferase [Flavobacteriales bacterium]|nr:2-oxoglutarate dehydrogenase complex dihydrolipoyllysine-residue succinyltransferase [Flavobacteriales bacterium]
MILEMKMPSPGESIREVEIAQWLVEDGEYVMRDQLICEIDSEKATLELTAEEAGAISIKAKEGDTIAVGDIVCTIDTSAKGVSKVKEEKAVPEVEAKSGAKEEEAPAKKEAVSNKVESPPDGRAGYATGHPSPAAKKMMDEKGAVASKISGTGPAGRITKADVLAALDGGGAESSWGGGRDTERVKMTSLRKKLAQRLVSVKNETAMLTTFNEIDMSGIMGIRSKYKGKFEEGHGVKLGFMSFFTKAVSQALQEFPAVNATIDGEEIVYHNFTDIGIAVSSPKGLMVPVLRNTEVMSFADIESSIRQLAVKARDGKLSLEEMTGGTFTITNGGTFGSMMSTPIINPPQSAILGMHNIVERPIAVNKKVEIRPMMYVALSYDHRIIDGKESVGFLVRVKEYCENPVNLLTKGKNLVNLLLDL